jgi:hypothetical protein
MRIEDKSTEQPKEQSAEQPIKRPLEQNHGMHFDITSNESLSFSIYIYSRIYMKELIFMVNVSENY